MGKGDKKTKKGKIIMGTFGNSRKHRSAGTSQPGKAPKGSSTAGPTAPAAAATVPPAGANR